MALSLRFQSTGSLPGGRDSVEMSGGSLTIGRGEENDLALPDPDRTISKSHCFLEERGGDYVLIDVSTNGTFLNFGSERLGDLPTPLNDGDVISVGPYELVVEIADGTAAVTDDPLAGIAPPLGEEQVSPGSAIDGNGGGDFVGSLDDPAGNDGDSALDELLGSGPAVAGAQSPGARQSALIPEDPLEDVDPGIPTGDDPFSLGPAPDPFGEGGASEADHAPAEHDHFVPQAAQSASIPDDWDAELGAGPSAGAPAEDPFAAPPPEPIPEPPTAPSAAGPDLASAPSAPAAPARAQPAGEAPVAPASAAGQAAAAQTFLEAAGAQGLEIPDEQLEEVMRRLGAVFRVMVEGLREVLMTRASIKGEFRMSQTMIRSGGNNPLKFSISAEQAVRAMILPADSGYQNAEAAAGEALRDIKAHEVAMVTGMQAALSQVLARLDPERLTGRLETASGLGGFLGGGKKARYWEAYEKMYAEFAREAEDDFQAAFGKEFARAYEEQLRKL